MADDTYPPQGASSSLAFGQRPTSANQRVSSFPTGGVHQVSTPPNGSALDHTSRGSGDDITATRFKDADTTRQRIPSRNSRRQEELSMPSWNSNKKDLNEQWRKWALAVQVTANLKRHLQPVKRLPPIPPTTVESLKAIVKASWLSVLLIFIPVGWALHFANVSPVIVFVCTFIAIIPLAKLLAWSTEELAIRVGPTLGGLINATFGNAVELIVAILALVQCKLTVVQSSLVGSILSNLLLVLGMCFFAGGVKYSEQEFAFTPSQINSELLMLSVIAVLLPGAFITAVQSSNNSDNNTSNDVPKSTLGPDILKMSHGVAILLLLIYACNLIFTLWSHAEVMNKDSPAGTRYPKDLKGPSHYLQAGLDRGRQLVRSRSRDGREDASPNGPRSAQDTGSVADFPHSDETPTVVVTDTHARDNVLSRAEQGEIKARSEEDEEEQPLQMNMPVTVGLLVVVTILVGVTAEFLVDSIDGVTAGGIISEEWVGLILLPIVGNAAEHVTAVTVAVKDKLDLSISVAVGSSIQIALFVIPLMVVLSWILGKPLTMLFDPFESVVLFLSVITVNYCVQDSKSNWLEGMILMMLYIIIAVSFWFYPGFNPSSTLNLPC